MTDSLPDGACDCHVHIYEPGYPRAATATFAPPAAPVSEYRELRSSLGLSRVIVVQPTGYGFDNSCTIDAVKKLGPQAYGVAVVAPDTPIEELHGLHAAGIRGVRFMMFPGGLLSWDDLETIAMRIEPLGWHINLQFNSQEMPEREARLLRLPGKLVIDHLGTFFPLPAPGDKCFASLRRVLDGGRCWIKVSAPYHTSPRGGPLYLEAGRLAKVLIESHLERCLWASNWPHPRVEPRPNDAAMLRLALFWMGDSEAQSKILVENPVDVYGF